MQSLVYVIIAKVREGIKRLKKGLKKCNLWCTWLSQRLESEATIVFCSGPPANLVPIEDICLFFSFSLFHNYKILTQMHKCTILCLLLSFVVFVFLKYENGFLRCRVEHWGKVWFSWDSSLLLLEFIQFFGSSAFFHPGWFIFGHSVDLWQDDILMDGWTVEMVWFY